MTTDLMRADDWASLTGSLGSVKDKHTDLFFRGQRQRSRAELTDLYKYDPTVAVCCDKMADDVFRTPWEFDEFDAGITPAEAMAAIKPYAIEGVLKQVFQWGALYGACTATIPVTGSGDMSTPLRPGRGALGKSAVIVADDCRPYEVDGGVRSSMFGKVLTYQLVGVGATAAVETIHHSRLLVYEPIPLPMLERRGSMNGWGPSTVERLWNALGKDGAAASHAIAMMYVASLLYVQLEGFKASSKTAEGRDKIREMLALMRGQLDSLGILGLDTGDKIGNLSLAVTGAHELMDRMRDRLAAASPMPREILFKESPTGLRGGELTGPQALWYGTVEAFRRDIVTPLLDQWLKIAFASMGLPVRAWTIKWAPLWVPTQAELATNQLVLAQADAISVTTIGSIAPDEVRTHRHVKGSVEPLKVEPAAPAPALDLTEAPEPAGEPPKDVAAEAMNGAQISSLVEVAGNPALTREQKIGIISVAFPSIRPEQIAAVVGPPPDPNAEQDAEPGFADGDMVKVQRAAELLGVHTTSIMNEITKAGPERVRVRGVGGQRVVSLRDLRSWLDRDGDGKPDPEHLEPGDGPDQAQPTA